MTSTLPISDIINIVVQTSPQPAIPSGFNLGLIVGASDVIPGSTYDRVRVYADLAAMISDGFASSSPEYGAAVLYFGQSPRPPKVAIGRWISTEPVVDALTACRRANTDWYQFTVCGVSDIEIYNLAAWAEVAQPSSVYFYTTADAAVLNGIPGTSQIETATVVGSVTLAGNAEITVTAASMDNSPKTMVVPVLLNDNAAAVAAKIVAVLNADPDVSFMFKATSSGASVALEANLQAVDDNTFNVGIGNGTCTGLTPAPMSVDTAAGVTGSLAGQLKALGYTHTLGQYSTTPDAVEAIGGYAMGANTGAAGSAYTLAYKPEIGVPPEALTEQQVANIKNTNCNAYINRGNTYNLFEQGVMASGMHFDERLGLDLLANSIRIAVMNLLIYVDKVPQDEQGITLLFDTINVACKQYGPDGTHFLGAGRWNGPQIKTLNTGDMLVKGYTILADSIDDQPQMDRSARKAPNIYIPIKLAGAVESIMITVQVNE